MPEQHEELGQPRTGCPRWLRFAFILSVAANMLALGVIGAHFLSESRHPRGPDKFAERIVRLLPPERRDSARAVLLSRTDEVEAARQEQYEAYMTLVDALSSDQIDPDGIRAALARRADLSDRRREMFNEQLIALMMQLPHEDRVLIAGQFRSWADRRMKAFRDR